MLSSSFANIFLGELLSYLSAKIIELNYKIKK